MCTHWSYNYIQKTALRNSQSHSCNLPTRNISLSTIITNMSLLTGDLTSAFSHTVRSSFGINCETTHPWSSLKPLELQHHQGTVTSHLQKYYVKAAKCVSNKVFRGEKRSGGRLILTPKVCVSVYESTIYAFRYMHIDGIYINSILAWGGRGVVRRAMRRCRGGQLVELAHLSCGLHRSECWALLVTDSLPGTAAIPLLAVFVWIKISLSWPLHAVSLQ